MAEQQDRIALVLAGGGARGAYEAGALADLLPELERRGERPRLVIGTSVGALNAAFVAANAHLPTSELIDAALAIWRSVSWGEVVRDIVSGESLLRLGEYAAGVVGVPGAQLPSLLDPGPLRKTIGDRIDFGQIATNVGAGDIDAAAVVALSALTGRSVVFHQGLASPATDTERGIDYVPTALTENHVLASAAIPVIFPAVHVDQPDRAVGWYFDGGTRLNTPIKPALEFGADRIVTIALSSLAPGPTQIAGEERPDALDGAGQLLQAVLGDQLLQDVQTLARRNEFAGQTREQVPGLRPVPYILIAPERRDTIAQLALKVFREHYSGALQSLRAPNIALLGRLIGGGSDARHADLLSFLLFAPEFAEALIELGRHDARRWLADSHGPGEIWQLARPTLDARNLH